MKRLLPLLLALLFLPGCGSVNAAAPEADVPPFEEAGPPAIILPKEEVEEPLPVRTVDPGRPMVA